MRRMTAGMLAVCSALVAAAALVMTVRAQAQGSGAAAGAPGHVLLQVWHVKPDSLAAFRDLVSKELLPAQKKAGLAYRWTWSDTPMGGTGFTFVTTQPVANYAQLSLGPAGRRGMGDAAWNDYNNRFRATLTASESFIYTLRPDLSYSSGLTTAPAMIETTEWQALPGKAQEFASVLGRDYLPNYRKAGVKDLLTYVVDYGDTPANHFVIVRSAATYADFDGPGILARAGLSAEAVAEINGRRGMAATGMNRRVFQFVPELSFGSPAAASATR